jgi:hypothetical protein
MMNGTGIRNSLRLAGAAVALTLAVSAAPQAVFADGPIATHLTIAPLPIGKKLTAFSKNAYPGATGPAQVSVKNCLGQITQEFDNLYMRVRVTPGPCDEGFSKSVLNGYLISYTDVTRRLPDLRGHFEGNWRLIRPDGFVLANGTWRGTVGVGTHRAPGTDGCEDCKEPLHYEGEMTGRVLVPGSYYGASIRATLAGTGPMQPWTAQRISIEGVVVSNCYTLPHIDLPLLQPALPDLDRFEHVIDIPELKLR